MDEDRSADRIEELEADNQRLRRLLDQAGAPSELRHRTRSILALLRGIIRKSAESRESLEDYVGHLEDRLDAVARVQTIADEHGSVMLESILRNEFDHYRAREGASYSISGPEIEFQPRAAQTLALAIHELAVNSVEHGVLGTGAGRIDVTWWTETIDETPDLFLIWQETSTENSTDTYGAADRRSGFGTEVVTGMLPYELEAEAKLSFAGARLTCEIRMPLPSNVGQIVASASP